MLCVSANVGAQSTTTYVADVVSVTNKEEVPEYLMPVGGCESLGDPNAEPTQFRSDGSVIEGPGNNWGAFQINGTAHDDRTKALGIDYMTYNGNVQFAKLLYEESGYRPWYQWSGHCWENDPRIDQQKLKEARGW